MVFIRATYGETDIEDDYTYWNQIEKEYHA